MLRRIGVVKVKTVDSGPKALDVLKQGDDYDLVISDIQMPEMSGTELSEAIRRDDKIARRPVVVGLTASTSEGLYDSCTLSGMSRVLSKPLAAEQLQAFLDEFLDDVRRVVSPLPAVSRSSTLRVLVVDDAILNLQVLERMLMTVGVAQVTTVDCGFKALGILEKEHHDLVITDVNMPEMSGMELCDAIGRDDSISTKPIVVGLTAGTSEEVDRQCRASGMRHVLHKPVTLVQIKIFLDEKLNRIGKLCEYPTTGEGCAQC